MSDDEDNYMTWETLEQGVVTQADCLGPEPWYMPVPWDSGFSELGPQLEKAEDFDKWYLNVVQVLEDYDLKDLIDANFPRPAKKHHQAEDWLRMSQDLKSGWPPAYIGAVRAKFMDMYAVSPILASYYALMRILNQINEAQVVSDAMRTLAMRNHDNLVDKFTTEDFRHYCDRMIHQLGG